MKYFNWHEQKVYKNLYEIEISILKRGLKGSFILHKLYDPDSKDGRIKAIGTLFYGETQQQDIVIVFPTKYPFLHPKIITISLANPSVGYDIDNLIPFPFNKGNQYGDCSLCLFENNFWNPQIHNIGFILKRSQEWLNSATSKNGFSPDEIVEELPSPFPHVGQVLIPKDLPLPKNSKTGQFTLSQFKPNNYILEQNILSNNTFQLSINTEVFKWYSFPSGITLKDILPNADVNNLRKVFLQYFGEDILTNGNKNIALYLPSDHNSWHFFKFNFQLNGNNVGSAISYFISRNISNELYLRTKDIFSDQILSKKKVTIIGLGAIGSEVAKSLARNGVGHFNLFDKDTFEIGNSVRHAADLYYIGDSKVNVVKQLILRSNPNITVNEYKIDILNDAGLLEQSILNSDLCIVLTAEESVDYLINDHYIQNYKIPFVFARLSAGAMSGSVQIIDKNTPCLRCLSAKGNDTLPKPKTDAEFEELPPEYGSCSMPALPGSEVDTKEVALQVTRIVLQLLLDGQKSNYPKLKHNQFYWHGPFGSDDKDPFTWEMRNFKKNSSCIVCKR